jgi:hypothetical protein
LRVQVHRVLHRRIYGRRCFWTLSERRNQQSRPDR